jgi:hypothetical protein
MTHCHCATAFGIRWRADLPLTEFVQTRGGEAAPPLGEVEVRRIASPVERRPLRSVNRGFVYADGIRLDWKSEAMFDMFDGERVDYCPGERWRGALPSSFYSTVAALTLAWRGAVPLHASAVEIGGRAALIAGPSGAGKSSLTTRLIALGARFIADDLSVVRMRSGGYPIDLFPGRPAIRLHADSAALLSAHSCEPATGDARGKWLLRPVEQTSRPSLPLGAILLLERNRGSSLAGGGLAALASNLFRPKWLAALPNHASIKRDLLRIAASVPIRTFQAIETFDPLDEVRRGEQAMTLLEAALKSGDKRTVP